MRATATCLQLRYSVHRFMQSTAEMSCHLKVTLNVVHMAATGMPMLLGTIMAADVLVFSAHPHTVQRLPTAAL